MFTQPMPRSHEHKRRKKIKTHFVKVRHFQYRYVLFLASFGFIFAVIVIGLCYYLLNHNFELLVKAQLNPAPRIVDHIYSELKLANEMLAIALIGFVALLAIIGLRFSQRIVIPILVIQEKMKEICRGNLNDARVRIRKTDEFQEMGETYNYMVEVLKAQTRGDLERLKGIKPDEYNRDAVLQWNSMVTEKESQINESIVSADPTDVSRRVS